LKAVPVSIGLLQPSSVFPSHSSHVLSFVVPAHAPHAYETPLENPVYSMNLGLEHFVAWTSLHSVAAAEPSAPWTHFIGILLQESLSHCLQPLSFVVAAQGPHPSALV